MSILPPDEKCPHCGAGVKDGLFVCSMGAVNCANCGQFVRPLTPDEMEKRMAAIVEVMPKLSNRTPLAVSLRSIRCIARITLREMSREIGVDVSEISGWEHGRSEPDIKQLDTFIGVCSNKIEERKP